MVSGKQDELSPWTSGSWNFDPGSIRVIGPAAERRNSRSVERVLIGDKKAKRVRRFGLLPEQEYLRLAYIALFAFSGFVLALLVLILMS